jgi:hypothetical protein
MRRRTLSVGAALGMVGWAGCSAEAPFGRTPTGTGKTTGTATAEPTPACRDTSANDSGDFSFDCDVKTDDGERYDRTLRIVHVRTPPCRYEDPACETVGCKTTLAKREYRVTDRTKFDEVDAPVTGDVDSYRLEWTVDGETATSVGLEQAACSSTSRSSSTSVTPVRGALASPSREVLLRSCEQVLNGRAAHQWKGSRRTRLPCRIAHLQVP